MQDKIIQQVVGIIERPYLGVHPERVAASKASDIIALLDARVPADVRRLVVASRMVAYGGVTDERIADLDKASEAFASRVPWDDAPDDATPTDQPGDGAEDVVSTEAVIEIINVVTDLGDVGALDRAIPEVTARIEVMIRAALTSRAVVPDGMVIEALRAADGALRNHACHGGEGVPCARAAYQCQLECGREAGDALLLVESALSAVPSLDGGL